MFPTFLFAISLALADPADGTVAEPETEVGDPSVCEDLGKLKRRALVGKLQEEQVVCLEATLQGSEHLDRDAISTMLLADAHAKGDKVLWAARAIRHLTWIDGTDAALASAYAAWLVDSGGEPDDALHWIEVAFDNDYQFDEDTRDDRLYGLFATRARAYEVKWRRAQEASAADSDSTLRLAAFAAQGRTRLYAVEWMQHAHEVGRSTDEAFALCVTTGWTEERCAEALEQ